MPIAKIYTNFKISDPNSFITEFHNVMKSVLKIPDHDRLVILNSGEKTFFQPFDTEGPYILFEITLFKGRTIDTKRNLYKNLVQLADQFEVKSENIRTILYEVEKDNWGIRGGKCASDLDLGFNVNI